MTFDRVFEIARERNATLTDLLRALQRSRVQYTNVAAGYASDWEGRLVGNLQPPLEGSTLSNRVGADFTQAGVELRWTPPWWHKDDVKYDTRASQVDIAIAEANYAGNLSDLAANLLKAYIQVRRFQEKLRVSAEQEKVDRARRDFLLQEARLGKASDLALISQEANLQNQEATTAHLRDQLVLQEQTLFNLMNVPALTVRYCSNYFEFFTFDPAAWETEWALQEQTRNLKLQLAKQEIEYQKSKITWQPYLSLRASYGREFSTSGQTTQDVLGLGAILTVPLPNFPQIEAKENLARHDVADLLAKLDQTVLTTQRSVADDRERLARLNTNLQSRKRAMQLYDQQLEATRLSFQLGLIDYLQVQTIENSIMQSTQSFYDDLADYITLAVDYAKLHGRPFPVPTTCTVK